MRVRASNEGQLLLNSMILRWARSFMSDNVCWPFLHRHRFHWPVPLSKNSIVSADFVCIGEQLIAQTPDSQPACFDKQISGEELILPVVKVQPVKCDSGWQLD